VFDRSREVQAAPHGHLDLWETSAKLHDAVESDSTSQDLRRD
jgi:hypothetical protein